MSKAEPCWIVGEGTQASDKGEYSAISLYLGSPGMLRKMLWPDR